ncbi:Gamma-tubulin complex component 6, partial [Globisporangium splendens]
MVDFKKTMWVACLDPNHRLTECLDVGLDLSDGDLFFLDRSLEHKPPMRIVACSATARCELVLNLVRQPLLGDVLLRCHLRIQLQKLWSRSMEAHDHFLGGLRHNTWNQHDHVVDRAGRRGARDGVLQQGCTKAHRLVQHRRLSRHWALWLLFKIENHGAFDLIAASDVIFINIRCILLANQTSFFGNSFGVCNGGNGQFGDHGARRAVARERPDAAEAAARPRAAREEERLRAAAPGVRAAPQLQCGLITSCCHVQRERISDPEHHIVRKLGHVRLMLKEHTDTYVLLALRVESADAFPIEGAMRVLVALSGGHDGQTFRLEDPMRIAREVVMRAVCARSIAGVDYLMQEKQRLGEQIRMNNVHLVFESSGLFNAESIPLHEEKYDTRTIELTARSMEKCCTTCLVLAKHKFGLFDGNLSDHQSSLWVPDAFPTELGAGFLGNMSFGPNSFMMLAVDEANAPLPDIFARFPSDPNSFKHQPFRDKKGDIQKQPHRTDHAAEVFFFDGTKEVHCSTNARGVDWQDDTSSQTASSSDGSMILEHYECYSPSKSCAWEDIGDVDYAAKYSAILREEMVSRILSVDPAVNIDRDTLEVCEIDVIEDALRVLNGVESTIFRRDVQSASFQLPEKRKLKLRNGTVRSLLSTLESVVENIAVDAINSGSIVSLLARTRLVCRQLHFVAVLFQCTQEQFWPLLGNGRRPTCSSCIRYRFNAFALLMFVMTAFPRGIALLNHLHSELIKCDLEDTQGNSSRLVTWFLRKTSAPYLEALSEFISCGHVTESVDPYDEFSLTKWSNDLTEVSVVGSGDPLLAKDFGNHAIETIVPNFLHRIRSRLIRLGITQRLLQRDPSVQQHQNSQAIQRELLEQQIEEEAQLLQTERELETEADEKYQQSERKAREERDEGTKQILLERYAALMTDADSRHQHAKWRRNRAVCCSTARQEMRQLLADDKKRWEEGKMENSEDGITASSTFTDKGLESEASAPISDSAPPDDADIEMETEDTAMLSRDQSTKSSMNPESVKHGNNDWRYSVRVNSEAGNRSLISLSSHDSAAGGISAKSGATVSAQTRLSSQEKATVRVLREPGDSGKSVFQCLYGDPNDVNVGGSKPTKDESPHNAHHESLSTAETSFEESECRGDADAMEVDEDTHPESAAGSTLSDQDDKVAACLSSSLSGEKSLPEDIDDETPDQVQLPTLPEIHDFFSHQAPSEDLAILMQSLTAVPTHIEECPPFPLIVRRCVESPVGLIGETLDRLALELFLGELHLMEHLKWLHDIMLMAEGLCMDIFARDFLAGVRSETRVSWGLSDRWTSALSLAMIESRIHSEDFGQRFYYNTSEKLLDVFDTDLIAALGSMTMAHDLPSLLREVGVQYTVQWPLGAVITSQSLRRYASIHRFLLYSRLTNLDLKETWMVTRKLARQTHDGQALLKCCDNVFYKTQSLIGAFNEAFVTKVLLAAWTDLEQQVTNANDVVQLRVAHERYVATAESCCFLDSAGNEIHKLITQTFDIAVKLSSYVRTHESRLSGDTHADAERAQGLWKEHNATLRALVDKLQGIESDREHFVREFAKHLLLRLNFNEYFPAQEDDSAW